MVCQWLLQNAGLSARLLLMFEVALIAGNLAHTVLRYTFHLYDTIRSKVGGPEVTTPSPQLGLLLGSVLCYRPGLC
jgi:hypothetical protein